MSARTSASVRVFERIRDQIASGELQVGDQLPTRAALCREYGIASMTAARVVRMLNDEGLAESDAGRGVFVTAVPGTGSRKPGRLEDLEARVSALEAIVLNRTLSS